MNVSIAHSTADVNLPDELAAVIERLRSDFAAPGLAIEGVPTRLSGGFWAEMWSVAFSPETNGSLPERIVLRLAPDAALAAWEATFQSCVHEQGFPTPAIFARDIAPTTARRAWSVMEHADGQPLLSGLNGIRVLSALPKLATSLPDTLARAAAELHRLDPAPISAALEELGERRPGVDGLLGNYIDRSKDLSDRALRRFVERLATTRPAAGGDVVCHGDLHPFNILANDGGIVVLDWTAGQIAHPAYDLAFTHLLMSNPPLAAPKSLRPIVNAAAQRLANRFLTTYQRVGPRPIDSDTLDWYRRLQACRILADLAGWRADGTIDQRQDHPWLSMEPTLKPLLAA